ncbi:CAP domain-containing protein [Blastocladiella britannica]|nr:CAP domain-containing protein [Blastocladiella britannica]
MLLVVALALLAVTASANEVAVGNGGAASNSPAPAVTVSSLIITALDQVNAFRARNGRRALCLEPRLIQASQAHSADMAAHRFLEHNGSNGQSPFARMSALGYGYTAAAENIAYGSYGSYQTIEGPLNAWEHSSGHLANLLGDYTQMGIGMASGACPGGGGTCYYWTQDFGKSSLPCLNQNTYTPPAADSKKQETPVYSSSTPAKPTSSAAAPKPAPATPAPAPAPYVSPSPVAPAPAATPSTPVNPIDAYDYGMLSTPNVVVPPTAAGGASVPAYQAEFLTLVNAHRRHHNASRVCLSTSLIVASQRQANDTAQRLRAMTHVGSDGSSARDRMLQSGFPADCGKSAEIIGAGANATFVDPAQAVLLWLDSDNGHDNVMCDAAWTHLGLGRALGDCPVDPKSPQQAAYTTSPITGTPQCYYYVATWARADKAECIKLE